VQDGRGALRTRGAREEARDERRTAAGRTVSLSGVVVTGRRLDALAPLEAIGLSADPADLPMGGRFRLRDLALAACRGAGAARVCVVDAGDGASRVARALEAWERLDRRAAASVVLVADHLFHADLGAVARRRREHGAAVALACLPAGEVADRPWPRLAADDDGRVTAVGGAGDDLPLAWPGDLIVGDGGVRALAAGADDDVALLARLVATVRVVAVDAFAEPGPERAWCTSPSSVEAWYDSQMALCGPVAIATAATLAALPVEPLRPPARLLAEGGHFPQVVNALVAEDVSVLGATVLRSVLAPGVVVEAGAEVEDSILLAGARIGRGAAVRRAIVGPGARIAAGERVGWGDEAATTVSLPSGLCLVGAASGGR
jgi:ADP-glucose pyrophosphorylase